MSLRVYPPGTLLKTSIAAKKKPDAKKRAGDSEAHLALVRKLPCCTCGQSPGGQAHHVKSAGGNGVGLKVEDKWTVPICNECHINGVERAGSNNEVNWFRKRGIDCLLLAKRLWDATGDLQKMREIVLEEAA